MIVQANIVNITRTENPKPKPNIEEMVFGEVSCPNPGTR
jgi:hypothetical protein